MSNVPHSGLTGVDLHESKGTASAAANTVFVADGVGSGSFAKIPAAALAAAANPFAANLLHVREEQGSGQASTTSGAVNAFVQVALNTVKTNEIAGASLVSNQILLPAGTYFIDAVIPYFMVAISTQATSFRAILRNLTASNTLHFSRLVRAAIGGTTGLSRTDQGAVSLHGRFTLATGSTLELQSFRVDTGTSPPSSSSAVGTEVYAEALIWKTA